MAISATLYELLAGLPVARGSTLLEIGEANWYGDLDPESVGLERDSNLFHIAKQFYNDWFVPSKSVAIDMNGSDNALRLELNLPINIGELFDVVINHGTAEHIFNIAQVFESIHNHCDVNGWMIHDAPFNGWIDHGFYCLQPTLFYDVALANCYETHLVAIHEVKSRQIVRLHSRDDVIRMAESIPRNALLFAAFRKRVEQPFRIPVQGYYARTISRESQLAWSAMR